MDTPTISRSGRVVKKSIKLIDMEDVKPIRRESKTPKSSVVNSLIAHDASALNAADSSPSNLKIKLSFTSGDFKIQPKEKLNLSDSGNSGNSGSLNIHHLTQNSGKIPLQLVKGSSNSNSLIFKLKQDENEGQSSNAKRVADSVMEQSDLANKKPKLNDPKVLVTPVSNNVDVKPIIATSTSAVKTVQVVDKVTPIIQRPKIVGNKVELPKQEPASMKHTLSPISQIGNDAKVKLQQSLASSTPKINTIISSKLILARSIQEQKRINQSNRAKLAALTPLPPLVPPPPPPSARNSQSGHHHHKSSPPEDDGKKKKASMPSAYVLWCKETRSDIQKTYPELDFANLSRKMGEIWHHLPNNEKAVWFNKARMIAKHGGGPEFDSFYLEEMEELAPKVISDKLTLPITIDTLQTFDENFINGNNDHAMFENEEHNIGIEMIDIQGYLNILGDSLMAIGSYLQRGIKHNCELDYQPSAALSTMLDTALVAMGSLNCLTLAVPKIAPHKEKLMKTLDSVTYFMPPSDLS